MTLNARYISGIRNYLLHQQETVAIAESVTGGFMQGIFSTMPDAEKFFQGGITAYNIGQKTRHLHIEPIHAFSCNCVSPAIANQMALGASTLFSSHWSIGVTGYASPVPESGKKIFAYYAIAYRHEVLLSEQLMPARAKPVNIQQLYVREILKTFSNLLQGNQFYQSK